MSKLLVAVIILTLIPLASSYTYLNIYLDETGKSTFLGESNENLSLSNGITLENEKIRGSTSSLTSKSQEMWEFAYSLKNAEIKVFLPANAKVLDANGDIFLERNRIVVYSVGESRVSYLIEPAEIDYFTIILVSAIVFVIVVILYFIYRYLKNKTENKIKTLNETYQKPKEKDKLAIIKKILNEREKLILDNLKKSGKIKMYYLRKLTGIPKASFSRHLIELEKKHLIKRSGEGKNKFVELGQH